MKLVHTIKELQSELDALRNIGKTIGLVPTMGALHAGHASLVKRAVAENDVVVVSDFVNPTQFNDRNDLIKYPRTLDADCELLEKVGASFVFAPSVEEIYPEPDTRRFSYAPLDTVMEGRFRPGHFNGVCQIVSKLFMFAASHTVAETQKFVENAIAASKGLRLEYFEIVDGNSLQKIANWEDTEYAVGCITVFCGEVRLIDNIKYKEKL